MSDNISKNINAEEPLSKNMEEWEEFLEDRYSTAKSKEEYRIYDENTDRRVQDFYRINHRNHSLVCLIKILCLHVL